MEDENGKPDCVWREISTTKSREECEEEGIEISDPRATGISCPERILCLNKDYDSKICGGVEGCPGREVIDLFEFYEKYKSAFDEVDGEQNDGNRGEKEKSTGISAGGTALESESNQE